MSNKYQPIDTVMRENMWLETESSDQHPISFLCSQTKHYMMRSQLRQASLPLTTPVLGHKYTDLTEP